MFTKMLGEMMMLQELSNDDKKTHARKLGKALVKLISVCCQ